MSPGCSDENVEFLARLTSATAIFETSIRASVPDGIRIMLRDENPRLLGPGDKAYEPTLRKFRIRISGEIARQILSFLYSFERNIRHNQDLFKTTYQEFFRDDEEKWKTVLYHFPRIDQTTISMIFSHIPPTTLGYRLEDLDLAGLVVRNNLKPPSPKHVRISSKGADMIEIDGALEKGKQCLRAFFDTPSLPYPNKPGEHDEAAPSANEP